MNRLAGETSPYLLQHADNPVDWYPWGDEALAKAKAEDKTVFLTPDGEPFFGGTYFPPEARHGLPSFTQVLVSVSDAYRERRADIARSAETLTQAIRESAQLRPSSEPLTESILHDAVRGLRTQFDPEWGGFGRAPKFPPTSALEFLLRRDETEMVTATLDAMAAGGMYDLVGGGFHRYSVDERWLVPHFEKMLYDNALLAPAYLHAWVATGNERYRQVAEETLEYVLRELRLPEGGFASAQDADTEGVEGLTFTWTPEELADALGEERPDLLQPFEHGRYVLRGDLTRDKRQRLFEVRERRPKPALDDKAIASWNGLALAALAEGGRRLESDTVLQAAETLGKFLLSDLSAPEGRLFRTWRQGRAAIHGYLDDYADVANGLYELHVATGDLHWLHEARRLALLAVELFADEERGGFYLTPSDGERLVARKKDFDDHPTPSGNSMLAYVLLRLARIYGDDDLERRAVGVLRLVRNGLSRAPSAFGHALCALDLYLSPPRELAIIGSPDDDVAHAALRPFDPNAVIAFGPSEEVPLLEGKDYVDSRPAVYVCERFACRAPVTDPAELAAI